MAPDSLCVAWVNDGLTHCECLSRVVSSMQQQQQQSVCGLTTHCAYTKA